MVNTSLKVRSMVAALLLGCLMPAVSPMPVFAASLDPLPRARPEQVGLSSERLDQIAAVLNADIAQGKIPGAVIAISRKGKLAYFKAFGYRDRARNVPMTTDTIFSIASMTKPLTTVGVLVLCETGKLNIADPLSETFPQFADMKIARLDARGQSILDTVSAARPILVHDLLRHTSGLVYGGQGTTDVHNMYPRSGSIAASEMQSSELLEKLASLPLLHQPGEMWQYGFGLDVAGLIVEKISGEPLDTFLEQNLFRPLGMNDTGFVVPPSKAQRYAKVLPLDVETGNPQAQPDPTIPYKFACGGGCAVSTAGDYLRFAQMLLQKGKLGTTHILGRKSVAFMLSDQIGPDVGGSIADPTRTGYGFGLGVAVRRTDGNVPRLGSIGEFGWSGAYGTEFWGDPKEELVVVFMAATPGPIRFHYRKLINNLVYQALN